MTGWNFEAARKCIVVHGRGRQIEFRENPFSAAQLRVGTETLNDAEFALCAELKSVLRMRWEPASSAPQGHRRCDAELVLETVEHRAAEHFWSTMQSLKGWSRTGQAPAFRAGVRCAPARLSEPELEPELEGETGSMLGIAEHGGTMVAWWSHRFDARGARTDPYFSNEELERATRRDNVIVPRSLLVRVVGQEEEFGASVH